MTRLEKFYADFDGTRRVMGIRSNKQIRETIDECIENGGCPLVDLWYLGKTEQRDKLNRRAHKEVGGSWSSSDNFKFAPYAEEMSKWWEDVTFTTRRRLLKQLREFYE